MTAMILRAAAVAGAAMLAHTATADVSELPENIRTELYNPDLIDPNQPLGDSAYRDFVAKNRRLGKSAMRRPTPETRGVRE